MIKEQNKVIVSDLYTTFASFGLLAGNIAFNFIPGGNIFFIALSSLAGGVLFDDMISCKWERLFENLGLYNKNKIYPKHIKKEETKSVIKHFINLPIGITFQDFLKRQDLLESAMNRKVKIESENNQIIIKEYKTQAAECKWEGIFNNLGFRNKDGQCPKLLETIETKIGNRYIFKLPIGIYIKHFEQYKPMLESAFHKSVRFDLTNDYRLIVQIYDVKYKKVYKPDFKARTDRKLIIPIGITLTIDGEKEVYLNLDENFHTLIGGINGSGKTSIINIILTWACMHDIEIKIIDMKFGGDYGVFEKYKNLTTYINNADTAHKEAETEIKEIEKIMNDRAAELRKTKCKDYKEYNGKYDNGMQPLITVIDEYIELSNMKGFNDRLNKILAKARATNIKIIMAIQRPCRENLNTKLKANLNNTIAFMTKNHKNSEILLDEGDTRAATDLHETGEAILMNNRDDIMFKSYFLTDEQIKKIIRPHYSYKGKFYVSVDDSKATSTIPKSKQLAVLEQNKVVDLL